MWELPPECLLSPECLLPPQCLLPPECLLSPEEMGLLLLDEQGLLWLLPPEEMGQLPPMEKGDLRKLPQGEMGQRKKLPSEEGQGWMKGQEIGEGGACPKMGCPVSDGVEEVGLHPWAPEGQIRRGKLCSLTRGREEADAPPRRGLELGRTGWRVGLDRFSGEGSGGK